MTVRSPPEGPSRPACLLPLLLSWTASREQVLPVHHASHPPATEAAIGWAQGAGRGAHTQQGARASAPPSLPRRILRPQPSPALAACGAAAGVVPAAPAGSAPRHVLSRGRSAPAARAAARLLGPGRWPVAEEPGGECGQGGAARAGSAGVYVGL